MCLVALDISKEVRFAAVTDTNGKLIAGKQGKDGNINNSRIKTRLFQLSSADATEYRQHRLKASATFCHYNSNYLFHANYLASTLKRIKDDMQRANRRARIGSSNLTYTNPGVTKNSH